MEKIDGERAGERRAEDARARVGARVRPGACPGFQREVTARPPEAFLATALEAPPPAATGSRLRPPFSGRAPRGKRRSWGLRGAFGWPPRQQPGDCPRPRERGYLPPFPFPHPRPVLTSTEAAQGLGQSRNQDPQRLRAMRADSRGGAVGVERSPGSIASLLSLLERPAQTCPGSEALPRDRGDLPTSSPRSSRLSLLAWRVLRGRGRQGEYTWLARSATTQYLGSTT